MSKLLQHWEGYVLDVSQEEFSVRLLDVTAGDTVEQEEATFPKKNFSEPELAGLVEGRYLTWKIYEEDDGKTRSEIVFL